MTTTGTTRMARTLAAGVALAALAQGTAHAEDASAAPAAAADTATPGLGEIVVTAQKRKENIQKTPIAITAITADRIAQAGLDEPKKLQFSVPSMNFSIASGFTYISLRGIGNNAASLTDSTVATYQDGVYTGMMLSQSVPTFDLQRIEVLRGPQGTLYGRNTTGGVINYITKDPDFELGAAADVSYGNYNTVQANAGLTGPLVSDKVAVRASFHYDDHDGYYRNVALNKNEYAGDSIGGRLAVLLRPTENLSIIVRGDMARSTTSNAYAKVQAVSLDGGLTDDTHPLGIFSQPASFFLANPGYLSPGDIAKLNGGSIASYYGLIQNSQASPADPAGSGTFANWDPTLFRTKASGVSLTATWDLGNVSVKSISAYRYGSLYNTGDISGRFTPGAYVLPINETNKQYTQELNLSGKAFDGKLDWLAGAFYYHMDGANYTATYLPGVAQYYQAGLTLTNPPGSPYAFNLNAPALAPFSSLPGAFPSVYQTASFTGPGFPGFQGVAADGPTTIGSTIPAAPFFGFAMTQKSDSYAGFVQATYHATDRLRLTGGIRYTIDRKVANRNVHSNFIWDLTAATIYQYVQAGILPPAAYSAPAIAAAANLCNDETTGKTWRAPTGTVGVDYDAGRQVLTYAKASWGYKAGGMNNGECGTSYDPEYLTSFEGGVKAVIADGQVLTNLAVYYYDYKNIQFATYSNNTSHILNAASATAFGVELEYAIRPHVAEGWQLDGSVSFQDSKYGEGCFGDPANTNNAGFLSTPKQACPATVINPNTGLAVPIGASANIKGNQLLRAPRWKTNVGLQYSTDVSGLGNIMARVDAAWTSKKYNAIWADKIPGTDKSVDAPFWIVNAV
ncbi:MAG: TonB-dependent receptor, partial [Sphingomonadales bacterium]|nr:TonB-dependent receptor [Sphingomonadales bacterium]